VIGKRVRVFAIHLGNDAREIARSAGPLALTTFQLAPTREQRSCDGLSTRGVAREAGLVTLRASHVRVSPRATRVKTPRVADSLRGARDSLGSFADSFRYVLEFARVRPRSIRPHPILTHPHPRVIRFSQDSLRPTPHSSHATPRSSSSAPHRAHCAPWHESSGPRHNSSRPREVPLAPRHDTSRPREVPLAPRHDTSRPDEVPLAPGHDTSRPHEVPFGPRASRPTRHTHANWPRCARARRLAGRFKRPGRARAPRQLEQAPTDLVRTKLRRARRLASVRVSGHQERSDRHADTSGCAHGGGAETARGV
jgi:hypothetical protein